MMAPFHRWIKKDQVRVGLRWRGPDRGWEVEHRVPAPVLLATTSYLPSMRSWVRAPIRPSPGAPCGLFRGWLSFFDMVVPKTPTVSYNVFSLLIISTFLFSFSTDTEVFFLYRSILNCR